ncbi:pyridoxal phosphate-dependent aminotransferase [Hymenobacter sp. BT491]|uniref:pyridoxal phosphate-dependent aminotransferase n=1 Tax=Hymenobacter sp. BT491 TaxID=2766779 RepID=UPI001653AA5D|nr:aminotransferase class I/II-fold pyridoxal phosphate-dependent enzyme [Hymenobacter sp. BT491]MBC6989330.1 aminotransferase class I/II-fold pyridoxal phosphate-dependent enzyme [Hymenobacter sp. BT491]
MHSAVISLASGYGYFPTPTVAVEAATRLIQGGQLSVSPIEGLPALREALASTYRRSSGYGVSPQQVVVTPGGKAALFALFKTLLRPGDEVLVPTPVWFGFKSLIEQAGGNMRPLPLNSADDYTLTPAAVKAAIGPRTRILLFSNPNNPTGRIYKHAEVEAILDVTRQHPNLMVISDEIYDLVSFSTEPVPSLLEFADPHAQHVVVNGFSKSLALVGWGVGYLVAPTAVAQVCAAWQFATAAAVPTPNQHAALAVTKASASITRELLAQLATTRNILLDGLADLPNVHCHIPEGTYYAFPDFTAYLTPRIDPIIASASLVTRLRKAGVDVVDGASCGAPGFVRLSYAVPEEALREALRRIRKALASAPVF